MCLIKEEIRQGGAVLTRHAAGQLTVPKQPVLWPALKLAPYTEMRCIENPCGGLRCRWSIATDIFCGSCSSHIKSHQNASLLRSILPLIFNIGTVLLCRPLRPRLMRSISYLFLLFLNSEVLEIDMIGNDFLIMNWQELLKNIKSYLPYDFQDGYLITIF